MTDDYRVFSVNEGNIKIINSVTAENEEGKQYTFQESILLFRVKGDKYFNEVDSERMYIIDGNVFLMSGNNEGDDIEIQFKELVEVSHQKPYKIKQLIDLKHNLQSECVL
jgi:phosphatidylserine/phosphatidylglycerophosphate/cardiolipin synthase-like enzyme